MEPGTDHHTRRILRILNRVDGNGKPPRLIYHVKNLLRSWILEWVSGIDCMHLRGLWSWKHWAEVHFTVSILSRCWRMQITWSCSCETATAENWSHRLLHQWHTNADANDAAQWAAVNLLYGPRTGPCRTLQISTTWQGQRHGFESVGRNSASQWGTK